MRTIILIAILAYSSVSIAQIEENLCSKTWYSSNWFLPGQSGDYSYLSTQITDGYTFIRHYRHSGTSSSKMADYACLFVSDSGRMLHILQRESSSGSINDHFVYKIVLSDDNHIRIQTIDGGKTYDLYTDINKATSVSSNYMEEDSHTTVYDIQGRKKDRLAKGINLVKKEPNNNAIKVIKR